MDIKIPSGPGGGSQTDAIGEGSQISELTESRQVEALENQGVGDPIASIAEQVAAGKMDSSQAVEQLLKHVLESGMMKDAPMELKQELEQTLRTMLETDPYLQSLRAGLE